MGEPVNPPTAAAPAETPGAARPSSPPRARRAGPADPDGLERTVAQERAKRADADDAAPPAAAPATSPAPPAELAPAPIDPQVAIRATEQLARALVYGAAIGATFLDADLSEAVLEAGTEVPSFAADVGPDLADIGGRYVVWGGHLCRFANIYLRKVAARKLAERRRADEREAARTQSLPKPPPPSPALEASGG